MGPYPEWTQEISAAGWTDEEWGSLPHTQKARALYRKSGALVMVPLFILAVSVLLGKLFILYICQTRISMFALITSENV